MKKPFARLFGVLVLVLLGCLPLWGQTTGSIRGVVETAKTALPGVTVEAKSPNLQGSRTAVTDAEGRFVLTLLPPGRYTVTATLEGFAPKTETMQLALSQAASIEIEIVPAKTESVTVTAEAAAVETDSNVVGRNMDDKAFQALPTGRNYSSVVQLASGVGTDTSDSRNTAITVYGSTGLENSYQVDGSNTTGVEYGGQGKTLNFEFIQEVEFKAGGYEAEYGGALGGIVNVVTKSGGNDYHGDAFGYFNSDSLQAASKHEDVVSPQGIPTGFTKKDFGADVGGFILKDNLWFFAAYDRVDNTQNTLVTVGPLAGIQTKLDTTSNLYSGKLTWRIGGSHTIIGTVFGDPTDDVGAVADPIGPPSTYEGTNKIGGTDWAIRYQGILSPKWLVTAQFGQHKESNNLLPGPNGDQIRYEDLTNPDFTTASGGFGNNGQWDTKQFKRTAVVLGANYFLADHDLKAGGGYEHISADVNRFFSGGQLVQIGPALETDPLQRPVYTHIFFASADSTNENPISAPLVATPTHDIISAYLQDTWKVLPNLTVNLGVRYEQQRLQGLDGVTYIDVNHFSPRVGFSWDFVNNGKSRLYGSYSQFVQQIPLDMNIRSLNGERDATFTNFDPVSLNCDPEFGTEDFCRIAGTAVNDIDPNLKSEYMEEGIVGVEYQVAPSTMVGVRGIYRSLQRVIEDTCHPYDTCANYAFVNPGSSVLAPELPFAKRYFRGIEVSAQKSFSNNWMVYASYLYSQLKGNFDGSFREIGGFNAKDPNITDDFDYPAFVVNSYGLLTIDRPNQAKLQVAYSYPIPSSIPMNLTLALTGYYASGTPLSKVGWYDLYGGPELFLAPRGSEGRTPNVYEMNAQLDYTLTVNPITIHILADVFNLLNKQQTTTVDQVYSRNEGDNTAPTPENPQYLTPSAFQGARSLRLGLRVSF